MKLHNQFVVLGSGPSSFACITTLVEKKITPLVLDIKLKDRKQTDTFFDDDRTIAKFTDIQNYYGKGGLSNLWGGSINKFYKKKNLKKYELEIEKAFEGILKYIHQAGEMDEYSSAFNLKKPNIILKTINNLHYVQNKKNHFFGYARSAMMKNHKIFNTSYHLNMLIKNRKIIYNNFFVEKITEKKNYIVLEDKKNNKIFCKKLFIGLGALNTSKLLIKSNIVNKISLKESRLIYSIWLSKKKLHFKETKSHADLFFSSPKEKFHNQIYFFKQITFKKIAENYLFFNFIPKFLKKIISDRLVLFFSYFDQSISRKLIIKKNINNDFNISVKQIKIFQLKFEKLINIIKHSFQNLEYIKSFQNFKFGFGNHYGSSFPIGIKKNGSDIYGRIKKFKNVHIIDASILPNIDANCITLNTMALSRFITTNCIIRSK